MCFLRFSDQMNFLLFFEKNGVSECWMHKCSDKGFSCHMSHNNHSENARTSRNSLLGTIQLSEILITAEELETFISLSTSTQLSGQFK